MKLKINIIMFKILMNKTKVPIINKVIMKTFLQGNVTRYDTKLYQLKNFIHFKCLFLYSSYIIFIQFLNKLTNFILVLYLFEN